VTRLPSLLLRISPSKIVRVALVLLSVGFGVAYLFGPQRWFSLVPTGRVILNFGIDKWIYGIFFLLAAILIFIPRREVRAAGYMIGAVLFGFFALLFLMHMDKLASPIPILNYSGNSAFFAVCCYETLFSDWSRRRS
jgi:hypothetical protein